MRLISKTTRVPRLLPVLATVLVFAGLAALFLAGPESVLEGLPYGGILTDCNGVMLRELPHPSDVRCLPVTGTEIAPAMRVAMVASEDGRFYRHSGIDPHAILRAIFDNLRYRRIVSGASTITWQIVRMAHRRPRTYANKIREARAAVRLDARYDKDELLTHYLNRAPFGGNLIGVEAAARAYFGKPASALDYAEAALLAGLPQAPSRFRPDRHLPAALQRRRYVLQRLRATGFADPNAIEAAATAIPEITPAPRPFLAPHFCDLVHARIPDTTGQRIRTTIDLDLQRIAEQIVASHSGSLVAGGIDGLALVILDARSSAVRALIGSAHYFGLPAGQVNGATALRSPGSALKPFVFTEAFDRGLLTPDEILDDRPLRYRDYRPENFDRRTRGSVTAREALAHSLNLPVLRLTELLELERLYRNLQTLGLGRDWREAAHYGLPLSLGAAEVCLLDLANAYAVLARAGEYLPLRLLESDPAPLPRRVWLAESAWLTTEILRESARLTLGQSGWADTDRSLPAMALKTGTSAGYRDAWCLAYNPDFVVGVWVGRTDGAGHSDLVGALTAAPIVAAVFRSLYPAGRGPWFARPAGVGQRRVCAHSGRLPGSDCGVHVLADFIPGVSGIAHCSGCQDHAAVRPDASGLGIDEPLSGSRHGVMPEDSEALIPLRAHGQGTIHWFVNNHPIGVIPADLTRYHRLAPGRHRISCVDAAGRTAFAVIRVESLN